MKVQCNSNRSSSVKLASAITLILSGWAVADQMTGSDQLSPQAGSKSVVFSTNDEIFRGQKEQSLIRGARLYAGAVGPALELGLNAYPQRVSGMASLVSTEAGAQLTYSTIPESDNLEFYLPEGVTTRISLQRAQAAFGVRGELESIDFEGSDKKVNGVHLVSALEKTIRTLAEKEPGVLLGFSNKSIALVRAGRDSVHLNIYHDDAGLSPMVEVVVYDSRDPVVRVLEPGLQREPHMPEAGIELDEMPCNLKVIGLLEYAESSVSTVVTDYLKDVVDSVQTDGILKQKLRTLGYLGEAAWSTDVGRTLGEAKRVTYNSYHYKFIPLSSGSYLVRLDDEDGSFRIVCKRMLELLEAPSEAYRKIERNRPE